MFWNKKTARCMLLMTLTTTTGEAALAVANVDTVPFNIPDTQLHLELVINGRSTEQVIPVEHQQGHYIVSSDTFKTLRLPIQVADNQPVILDQLENVSVEYDSHQQRLLLRIPSEWLPKQNINLNNSGVTPKADAVSSMGMLFNYDLYAHQPGKRKRNGYISAWNEQRLFGQLGTLNNTGLYRKKLHNTRRNSSKNGYMRYDTQWRHDTPDNATSYIVGDAITGSLPWSNSVRIAGFQLARNFTTRPDIITYPLPQFAGEAAVPSSVDLYINSYKTASTSVEPGPFTLNTVPYVNGSGQATITTTDALGRQISTNVPFYVASTLLRQGLLDYSASFGFLRKQYGLHSNRYGKGAASVIARYGLTNWLTGEGRAEGTEKLAVVGVGTTVKFGNFGVVNLSHSGSNNSRPSVLFLQEQTDYQPVKRKKTGQQTVIGYNYSANYFSLDAQYTANQGHFNDLSNYNHQRHSRIQRQKSHVTGSINLGAYGSLGVGYFNVKDDHHKRIQLVNASYTMALWKNMTLYTAINREIGKKNFNSMILLSIPFGRNGTLSATRHKDSEKNWNNMLSYSRSVPSDGGLGVNLAYSEGSTYYRQADFSWRTQKVETRAGIYGRDGNYTHWGEASGALIMMDSSLYASNKVNDSFILVSTDGYADVPVSYENQLIGRTNSNGHLLIPTVTSYYQANIQIDPLTLPVDVHIQGVSQQPTLRAKSGYLVKFPVQKINSVSFKVLDKYDHLLPKGSIVHQDNRIVGYVGWDGYVYLENIQQENSITVIRADNNQRCIVKFSVANPEGIQQLPEQHCNTI